MKKIVTKTISYDDIAFSIEIFDDTIDNIIEKLQNIKNKAKELGYINVEIRVESGYEGCYGLYINGQREETDTEYDNRIKRELKIKQDVLKTQKDTERRERKQLERLLKKYAPKNNKQSTS